MVDRDAIGPAAYTPRAAGWSSRVRAGLLEAGGWRLVAIGLGGAAVALAVLLVEPILAAPVHLLGLVDDADGAFTDETWSFLSRQAPAWVGLLALQGILWALVAVAVVRMNTELRAWRLGRQALVPGAVVVALALVFGVVSAFFTPDAPLPNPVPKVLVLSAFATAAAIGAALVLWRVDGAVAAALGRTGDPDFLATLRRLLRERGDGRADELQWYLRLGVVFQRALLSACAILGAGIAGSIAYRSGATAPPTPRCLRSCSRRRTSGCSSSAAPFAITTARFRRPRNRTGSSATSGGGRSTSTCGSTSVRAPRSA